MGLLIFAGVIAGIALVLALFYQLLSVRRSGSVIPMVRIGIAENNVEVQTWAERLRVAGIGCRVQEMSAIGSGTGALFANAYGPELWVREKGAGEARELLGLPG